MNLKGFNSHKVIALFTQLNARDIQASALTVEAVLVDVSEVHKDNAVIDR